MKVAMVEELIKAKGWNVDVMGERMRRHAETQIDRFWANRLEATYQQEKVKPQKEAILAAIWGSVQDIINQLKAPGVIHAGLFPDPARDLPAGWWWVKQGFQNQPPFDEGRSGVFRGWKQQFTISRASGFQFLPNGQWCQAPNNCRVPMPALQFTIFIMVDAESEPVASAAATIEYYVKNGTMQRIGQHAAWQYLDFARAGQLKFAAGPYLVILSFSESGGEHSTLEIGMHFARIILARIQAEGKVKDARSL